MRHWFFSLLVASVLMPWAGPASAGGGGKVSLAPTGRTIGGPLDTTINAGDTKTVVTGPNAVFQGCVTLTNTGNGAVNLNLVGVNPVGTTTVPVPARDAAIGCRAYLQSVTIQCLATGNGTCSVPWRPDNPNFQ